MYRRVAVRITDLRTHDEHRARVDLAACTAKAREEVRNRRMRESADEQLRDELARASKPRAKPKA